MTVASARSASTGSAHTSFHPPPASPAPPVPSSSAGILACCAGHSARGGGGAGNGREIAPRVMRLGDDRSSSTGLSLQ